jgi:Protein of unknown function (DUF2812).
MRFTVHRLFFAWDFDKEEKWLNEMAARGMNLQGVGFCRYVFEEGMPGEYQYHIEWLKNGPSHPESISYIRFLEEAGVEHIGSFKRWAYFRKKRADGAFDLYCDLDLLIDHFRRIKWLICTILPILIAYLAYSVWNSITWNTWPYFVPIFILYIFLTTCAVIGLVKTLRTLNRLKKERIMRE